MFWLPRKNSHDEANSSAAVNQSEDESGNENRQKSAVGVSLFIIKQAGSKVWWQLFSRRIMVDEQYDNMRKAITQWEGSLVPSWRSGPPGVWLTLEFGSWLFKNSAYTEEFVIQIFAFGLFIITHMITFLSVLFFLPAETEKKSTHRLRECQAQTC